MSPPPTVEPLVRHAVEVRLDPAAHRFEAVDALDLSALPSSDRSFRFVLHQGLAPEVRTRGWRLERDGESAGAVPLEGWVLRSTRRRPRFPVTLAYGGTIDHPPVQVATEYQRSFAESPGIIGPDGVVLSGASAWVPTFDDALVGFELTVTGLGGWQAVSQGERIRRDDAATVWRAADPMEEIWLVAGPWTERSVVVDGVEGPVDVRAFLRTDDPALAERYLGATGGYLATYEGLIGAYPYRSFALVENFWETGWGMPGFTLLGPEVMRFPWILGSSYPHELLHNWWGNGAYPGDGGNWCEGLTSYLADQLFADRRGEGAANRRATLQKYADFVAADTDFPLTAFGSRSSAASEAVGYGKSAMVFHMVRRQVGDEVFVRILRRFWNDARFRRVGYDAFAAAASAETGEDWGPWFDAWTTRTGAPTLSLVDVSVAPADAGFAVTVTLAQDGEPFPLAVPVAVTVEGGAPRVEIVALEGARGSATFTTERRPLRIDVDPQFDVMRRLDPLEVPPAVSTLLGAATPTFVLPSKASEAEIAAWTALATAWSGPRPPTLQSDDGPLPPGDVWILGRSNRHAGAADAGSGVRIRRSETDPTATVGLVVADPPEAIPGLARKLPHYGRYATLTFTGPEPTNTAKETGRTTSSPMTRFLVEGLAPELELPEPPALAD